MKMTRYMDETNRTLEVTVNITLGLEVTVNVTLGPMFAHQHPQL